jgi:AMP-binding enzyme
VCGQYTSLCEHSNSCKKICHNLGYIGDDEANAAAFSSDGWLKTGDLCFIDHDGFVYVVDRLKELIKYKAYQVNTGSVHIKLVEQFGRRTSISEIINCCFNLAGRTCRAGACASFSS